MPYPLISEGEQELTAHTPEFQTSESIHESLVRRYRALLDMAGVFAREHDIPQLFVELSRWLRDVAHFDLLIFALRDPVDNQMRLTFVHQEDQSSRLDMRVDGAATGWTWESQECVVIPDISREVRYPDTMKYLREFGMTSACLLPLTAPSSGRLGALGFASSAPLTYTERDIEFLQSVAQLCAVAVDNVLTHQALKQDKQKSELLLEISRSLSSSLKFERLFPAITNSLCSILPLDHAAISFPDKVRDGVNLFVIHPPLENCGPGEFIPSADSLAMPAIRERKVFVYSRSDLEKTRSSIGRRIFDLGVQHVVSYPLITSHGVIGSLTVGSSKSPLNGSSEYGLLCHLANHIAIALENARAYQEIAELKAKLAEEKLYLEDEIRTELNFEEIIGDSPQLKHALADVKTVADSDANVLILGETGTGKELIARAIHRMSSRKSHNFIKLNCAAIPTGLLESELFGHERGAFTGALTQKIGRLELADGGSVFLDEVGDIPLELQPKLLRVLQDQEFERLGSTRTIKVNVRLIAATNRDLASMVVAHEFRSDLYYRLRVFPIMVPPLRERRQDIPLLVRYFVQRFARRMNRIIDSIPASTMDVLASWDWPGNVRELENFLERSVILSKGPTLNIPAAELRPLTESSSRRDTSLETAEREHILRILRETGGVISGLRGAASRLGLKRTTLQSKMQKLGISRLDYQT